MKIAILVFLFNYSEQIMKFFDTSNSQYSNEFRPITDLQPNTFGYPSQIFLRANQGLQFLTNNSSAVKVLYYAYQATNNIGNPPSKRKLIFQISIPGSTIYVGVECIVYGWPMFRITITRTHLTNNLNEVMKNLNIDSIDQSFSNYYQNLKRLIVEDPEFQILLGQPQSFITQTTSTQIPSQLTTQNQTGLVNLVNQSQNPIKAISFPSANQSITGGNQDQIMDLFNLPQNQQNIQQIPQQNSQLNQQGKNQFNQQGNLNNLLQTPPGKGQDISVLLAQLNALNQNQEKSNNIQQKAKNPPEKEKSSFEKITDMLEENEERLQTSPIKGNPYDKITSDYELKNQLDKEIQLIVDNSDDQISAQSFIDQLLKQYGLDVSGLTQQQSFKMQELVNLRQRFRIKNSSSTAKPSFDSNGAIQNVKNQDIYQGEDPVVSSNFGQAERVLSVEEKYGIKKKESDSNPSDLIKELQNSGMSKEDLIKQLQSMKK